MPLSSADIRSRLQQVLARPDLFEDLTRIPASPPFTPPAQSTLPLGWIDGATLTIDAPGGEAHFTMEQIREEDGTRHDPGIALPNGIYFIYHTQTPNGLFPIFRIEQRSGTIRYTQIPLELLIVDQQGPELIALIQGRGLLLYNRTERPKPLFDFLTYDIQEWKSYEILFIDLCVNFARNHLTVSRGSLERIADSARNQDELFREMVTQLRSKAELYHRLEQLRDLLNLLTYLRYLGGTPWMLSRSAEARGIYRELIERTIPDMEAKLAEAGHGLTLDQLVAKMDEKLRELRGAAPLLGRIGWGQVRGASDAALANTLLQLVASLNSENVRAEGLIVEDMDKIRRALTLVPPRVMGIPRIFGVVEKQYEQEIIRSVPYFWAVQRLKSQASGFSLMLGLSSAFFSFFCPPVGIALGVFSAVISVDEASFKSALSDSGHDVDATFVSQAEAREAWFWAGVDVLFAAVDVIGGVSAAQKALRGVNLAEDLATAPRTVEELARIGGDRAQDARALKALERAAEPAAITRATSEIDVAAARRTLADDPGRVNLSSRSRQIEAPTSANAAIAEASPAVRQSIEPNLLPLVDGAYNQHFAEALARGQKPQSWDSFARDWYHARLEAIPQPTVAAPPRDTFYHALVGPSSSLGELLNDTARLRKGLIEQVGKGAVPGGLSRFDRDFLHAFRKQVRRGADSSRLDQFIAQRFLGPIDEAAAKAGFAPGEGRDFGLFTVGVRHSRTWNDRAVRALRNLFSDPAIEKAALHQMLNNPSYTSYAGTSHLNMEVAIALERIKGVEGVMNRVSESNPSLFQSLLKGNRGHAFEAIVVSKLLEEAGQHGAQITVGRRWWLRSIDQVNAAEGTRYTNVLEADLLVTLPDGRRILVDGKFYAKGLAIDEVLDTQLAKMADGINEGLIHNAEFWVSHHFVRSRQGLTNLEAFQMSADMYSHGRIHLVYDVFEKGIPGNFFDNSRFLQVSRGDVVLIPPAAPDLPSGVSGPTPIPAAAQTPPPGAVVPVRATIDQLEPAVQQSEVIRTSSTISRDLDRSYIPIHPLASSGRVTVAVAKVDPAAARRLTNLGLIRAAANLEINGKPIRELATGVATEIGKDLIRRALNHQAESGQIDFHLASRVPVGGEPHELYTLAFHHHAPVAPGTRFRFVLYSELGDVVDYFPSEGEEELLRRGWNVLPLTALEMEGGAYIYPLSPGSYRWVLQIQHQGSFITHPQTIPMLVHARESGGEP